MRIRFWAWSAIVMMWGCSAPDPKLQTQDVELEELQQSAAVKTCLNLDKTKPQNEFALQDEAVTYETHIKQVFETNCTNCHRQGGTSSLDLTSYTAVRANAAASYTLMQSTDPDAVMPPSGALPDADIQLLQAWIAAETPQGSPPVDDPVASTDPADANETTPGAPSEGATPAEGAAPAGDAGAAESGADPDACANFTSRLECREAGYLWTGDRCLALERLDCSVEKMEAAFATVDTDIQPSLVLPEGAGELQVEGCAQQTVAVGGKSTALMPIGVVFFENAEGQTIYRILTVEAPQ